MRITKRLTPYVAAIAALGGLYAFAVPANAEMMATRALTLDNVCTIEAICYDFGLSTDIAKSSANMEAVITQDKTGPMLMTPNDLVKESLAIIFNVADANTVLGDNDTSKVLNGVLLKNGLFDNGILAAPNPLTTNTAAVREVFNGEFGLTCSNLIGERSVENNSASWNGNMTCNVGAPAGTASS